MSFTLCGHFDQSSIHDQVNSISISFDPKVIYSMRVECGNLSILGFPYNLYTKRLQFFDSFVNKNK